jgi:predicted nucleic acid-binding protein
VIRTVVADAGPLIGLSRIGALHLLAELFGRVVLTETVRAELGFPPAAPNTLPNSAPFPYPGQTLLADAFHDGLLEAVQSPDATPGPPFRPLNPALDPGETSVIGLCLELRAQGHEVLLLIDDRAGRGEARHQGIPITGTAAVIALARQSGRIPAARPLLEALQRDGYFLGDATIAAVLEQVGEVPPSTTS